ncbi:hypothetical protein [Duodenibacillus massiliensis]|uniref:hypothetical protein n=1 Tax=Duodenibacillus massiliensis TaxID=1852381 RepID=UPI003AF4C7EF
MDISVFWVVFVMERIVPCSLSVLAAVSHVRDFLVFVAQVSSLPVRMAVYCGMSAVIVFFFWTAVKWGLTAAGIL